MLTYCDLTVYGPTDILMQLRGEQDLYRGAHLQVCSDNSFFYVLFETDLDEPFDRVPFIESDSAAYPMLEFRMKLYPCLVDKYIVNGEVVDKNKGAREWQAENDPDGSKFMAELNRLGTVNEAEREQNDEGKTK